VNKIKKLKLHGFNNLTKTLSFNIYNVCYTRNKKDQLSYTKSINETYNSTKLISILRDVSDIIGAKILNIAQQDYEPMGTSVTMMISEQVNKHSDPQTLVAHLDKSHLTVHTYPESHPDLGVCTFRTDIDVSTCGDVPPLKALNYLIECFESDIAIVDYRIRGFTRDTKGEKHFIDHKINSIQDFLSIAIKKRYNIMDINVIPENIFHSKMLLKEIIISNYLFDGNTSELSDNEYQQIKKYLEQEMLEIYQGKNC
jgi:S-adenosylmethionine decarboxylase